MKRGIHGMIWGVFVSWFEFRSNKYIFEKLERFAIFLKYLFFVSDPHTSTYCDFWTVIYSLCVFEFWNVEYCILTFRGGVVFN